ncbi:MAG: hypothetical protein XD66_0313, partial [Thermacetogenium phaeum]
RPQEVSERDSGISLKVEGRCGGMGLFEMGGK